MGSEPEPRDSWRKILITILLTFLSTAIGSWIVTSYKISKELENWQMQYNKTRSDIIREKKINLFQQLLATNYHLINQAKIRRRMFANQLHIYCRAKTTPNIDKAYYREKIKILSQETDKAYYDTHNLETMIIEICAACTALFDSEEVKRICDDIPILLYQSPSSIIMEDPNITSIEETAASMRQCTIYEAIKVASGLVSIDSKYQEKMDLLKAEILNEIRAQQ